MFFLTDIVLLSKVNHYEIIFIWHFLEKDPLSTPLEQHFINNLFKCVVAHKKYTGILYRVYECYSNHLNEVDTK